MEENEYYATLPTAEIGDAINRRVSNYFVVGNAAAQVTWWQVKAWGYAHGYGPDWFHGTDQIVRGGDQGEMHYVRMNQSGSILNAAVAQVTSLSMDMKSQADAYTSDSLRATKKADEVLEHIRQNCGAKEAYDVATLTAGMCGEGFILPWFDKFAGAPVLGFKDEMVTAGDFRFENPYPWDVIRNPGKPSWRALDDVTVKLRMNRFNLAKMYPASKREILDAPRGFPRDGVFGFGILDRLGTWDADDIQVMRYLLRPCAVRPQGRDVLVLRGGHVLSDTPLLYGMWPLIRIQKRPLLNTPFPYTEYFDCLGPQEVSDNLWSAVVTNLLTFGTSLVTYERGTNPDILALGGGLSLLPYDPGGKPPEVVNYARIPEAAPLILDKLKTEMEQYLGQNAVTRGQSPGDRAPASLAALLDATSARQANPFLQSYKDAIEYGGKLLLRMFQYHVKRPYRIAMGVGAPASSLRWKDVKPEDLKGIDQVYCVVGNDSFSSRLQKAEMLSTVPDPDHRREIMEVAETGRIEPVTLATDEMYTLVLAENEMIERGEVPIAHPSDDNYFHVKQHAQAVGTAAARTNPQILAADAQHFKQHYSFAFSVPLADVGKITAPALGPDGLPILGPDGAPMQGPGPDPNYMVNCQILRGQPVTPPGATVPGALGLPPTGTPPPEDGARTPTKAPAPGGSSGTKQAQLPPNASTKQKWEPAGGGGTATPGSPSIS